MSSRWDYDFYGMSHGEIRLHSTSTDHHNLNSNVKSIDNFTSEQRKIETIKWCEDVQQQTILNPASLFINAKRALHTYFNKCGFTQVHVQKIMHRLHVDLSLIPKLIADYIAATYVMDISAKCESQNKLLQSIMLLNYSLHHMPLTWFCAGQFPAFLLGECKSSENIEIYTIVPRFFDIGTFVRMVDEPLSAQQIYADSVYAGPFWSCSGIRISMCGYEAYINAKILTSYDFDYKKAKDIQNNLPDMMYKVLKTFDIDMFRAVAVSIPYELHNTLPTTRQSIEVLSINLEICRMTYFEPISSSQLQNVKMLYADIQQQSYKQQVVLELIRNNKNIARHTQTLLLEIGDCTELNNGDVRIIVEWKEMRAFKIAKQMFETFSQSRSLNRDLVSVGRHFLCKELT